jgi:hypothetical protein
VPIRICAGPHHRHAENCECRTAEQYRHGEGVSEDRECRFHQAAAFLFAISVAFAARSYITIEPATATFRLRGVSMETIRWHFSITAGGNP